MKEDFNCVECEDGFNLIRGLECFHCVNTRVKYYKKDNCKHININKITGLCLKCGYNTYKLTMKEYNKRANKIKESLK